MAEIVPALVLCVLAGTGVPPPVVLSEIHYHPRAEEGRAEFVEVANTATEAVDLSGWGFTKGIDFAFPAGFKLRARGFSVVCGDLEAFRKAFGDAVPVAGVFQGKLDNAGELLRLADAAGKPVSDVRYLDVTPWPAEADGRGASLQRVDVLRDADDPSNWAAARPTPGAMNAAGPAPPALSLFQVRHTPQSPGAGEAVEVSVSAHSPNPAVQVRLHFEIAGREGSVPMKPKGPGARGSVVFSASISGQPASTLVRYWAEATGGAGVMLRSPPQEAPTPNHAYFVEGPSVATRLPLYRLVMDLRALHALDANPHSNQLQPAIFIAQGEVYDRIQVRYRGAWARSWPKKCWKVVFQKDQPFGKRRRINLNSAWRDAAFIREALAYSIFAEAAAPSLESRMVRLHLNGEFFGLFVEVEQPRGDSLARNGLAGAVLYKAASRSNMADERAFGAPEELSRHYTLENGTDPGFKELWRFLRDLARTEDPFHFFETRVDIQRYVNYIAASALVQNWDAYNKNHFLAFDRASGKWSVLPWDIDRTLGDHWDWEFDVYNQPLLQGTERLPGTTGWNRMLDHFLAVPALRKRFYDRVGELLSTTFTEEKLFPRIESLREAIAPEADLDRARWGENQDWRGAIDVVKRYITERRRFLLTELPGGEAKAPQNLAPAPGSATLSFALALEASAFVHDDPKVAHHATRWVVRAEGASYKTPIVDETSEADLRAFRLEKGRLLPRTTYWFQVYHVDSNGKTSEPSAETSFATPDYNFAAVRFDLSRHFNRDVVANPGDHANDFLDDQGGLLIEDGFDGLRTGSPLAQGLPRDRKVGLHVLADYSQPNALQLGPADHAPVRVKVPEGRYSFIRLLVAGAGDSTMPIELEYSSGPRAQAAIHCDDWYDDNPPDGPAGSVCSGAVPILNGMDRIRSRSFKDRNEPAIFEVTVPVDASKRLAAFVLLPAEAVFEKGARGRFNLFAATGTRLGPE